MSGYIGTQPVPQATQTRDAFTATAAQTSFATGGYTPGFLDVFLNGVKLAAADYTATNGSDVVLAVGAALNDIVETVAYTTFEVNSNATLAQGALADTAVQPNDSPTFGNLTVSNTTASVYLEDSNDPNTAFTRLYSYGGTAILDVDPNNNGGVASTFRVSVDGSEAMRVIGSGNVGIGKTNPATPLDVNGTVTGTALTLGTWTITDTGGVLTFSSGGGAKFSINAAGAITAADNVTAYGTP